MNNLLIENWGLPSENNEASLIEAVSNKGKLYIEGVFMQANKVNRNKRIYPKAVLEKAVDNYIKEQVNSRQALGELNHPARPNVDPENAAILIEKLWWKGDNVMGKAIVLDTPKGKIVRGLMEGGWIPGVSSRGLGVVKENRSGINEVQAGYKLTVGVDVVWGPSAPDAYVRGVNESELEEQVYVLPVARDEATDTLRVFKTQADATNGNMTAQIGNIVDRKLKLKDKYKNFIEENTLPNEKLYLRKSGLGYFISDRYTSFNECIPLVKEETGEKPESEKREPEKNKKKTDKAEQKRNLQESVSPEIKSNMAAYVSAAKRLGRY